MKCNNLIDYLEQKIIIYSFEIDKSINDISILLSISGGIDSAVLSAATLEIKKKKGFKLYLAHFNHNLHKKSSELENYCETFAKINNVNIDIINLYFNKTDNIESVAREKRYFYLKELANKYKVDFVFTAHHKDDQIETLYMKKKDASDWISSIGIREKMNIIRRPFLNINKKQLLYYAKFLNIAWVEDPTNKDFSIRRNFIRHKIIPDLKLYKSDYILDLLENSIENLDKLNGILKKYESSRTIFVKKQTSLYYKIYLDKISSLGVEEIKLFIYWLIKDRINLTIKNYSRGFWNQFIKFILNSSNGSVFYLDQFICFLNRSTNELVIANKSIINNPPKIKLLNNKKWYLSYFKIRSVEKFSTSKDKFSFITDKNILNEGLYLRRWKKGESLNLHSGSNNKLISDLFINSKLSKIEKLLQPIIVNKYDNIVWVPGLAYAEQPVEHKTKFLREIKWIQN